jgi:hypothetical protein
MKVETIMTIGGELSLEVIAESPLEYRILSKAWEMHGYRRGNGQTITPGGESTGFYVPLCTLAKAATP